MALQKSKTARGVTGNYWQIANKNYVKDTFKTAVLVRCYVSAEVRATGIDADIQMPDFQVIREFAGDLTTAECYEQLKARAVVDGVETNWFADATDC